MNSISGNRVTQSVGDIRSVWVPAIVMAMLIAYAAGQPLMTLISLLNLNNAHLFALPLQLLVGAFAAWRLSRLPNIYRRWGWGGIISGALFLSGIACIPILASVGSADGSAAGTDAAATALFFVFLIFGLPMLVMGGALVGFGLVMLRKARETEPAR